MFLLIVCKHNGNRFQFLYSTVCIRNVQFFLFFLFSSEKAAVLFKASKNGLHPVEKYTFTLNIFTTALKILYSIFEIKCSVYFPTCSISIQYVHINAGRASLAGVHCEVGWTTCNTLATVETKANCNNGNLIGREVGTRQSVSFTTTTTTALQRNRASLIRKNVKVLVFK